MGTVRGAVEGVQRGVREGAWLGDWGTALPPHLRLTAPIPALLGASIVHTDGKGYRADIRRPYRIEFSSETRRLNNVSTVDSTESVPSPTVSVKNRRES
eukprot:375240-Prorocentrum_minimum.AAC.1